jgi:hypothetical protein
MNTNSRLKKSITNAKVALLFFTINLFLQFFYRRIFLIYLGSEVLGLNTTALNFMQFLNLAELGVGAAVSYSLYKPLAFNDYQQLNEIISIQGYLYRKIGVIIFFAGIILMLFFPIIFSGIKIPLWYTYSTFGILFISALTGYFLNYQQILLISDQKEYLLNYVTQGAKALKVILQIASIFLLSNGYLWWLFWEILAIIFTVTATKYVLKKEYPWLRLNVNLGKELMKKHPDIANKTKQLFTHKLAGFALNESSPLLIFAFTSLTFMAIYGNYLLVIAGITALLSAVFSSTNAGVGNLVSEGNTNKIISIFEELFIVRFYLGSLACYAVYKLTPFFITLWVGNSYLMDNTSLFLLTIIMFINLTRLTVDSFLNAYGLFRDIGAPIVELVLNIGLSIFLGYLFGVDGVLIGALTSMCLIVLFWKPHFLFTNGFKAKNKIYFTLYGKLIFISLISLFITENALGFIKINNVVSIVSFLKYSTIVIVIFSSTLLCLLLLFTKGMRHFISRWIIYFNKNII